MKTVQSADGTTIAYDQVGRGPALILVDGALGSLALGFMEPLAAKLSSHLTVITYDRRGRGESTDTQPFALEREIEDIEALINAVGGEACLYGISSGAALALEATIKLGHRVKKLALYEAPYDSDAARKLAFRTYRKQLVEVLAEGRGGDALALFMMFVGMPPDYLEGARKLPMWPTWEAVAHTLTYDAAALGEDGSVPTEKAARVRVPTLVMDGSASFPFMHTTAVALAQALPNGEQRTLEGQTHEVDAVVLAPVVGEFFTANAAWRSALTTILAPSESSKKSGCVASHPKTRGSRPLKTPTLILVGNADCMGEAHAVNALRCVAATRQTAIRPVFRYSIPVKRE